MRRQHLDAEVFGRTATLEQEETEGENKTLRAVSDTNDHLQIKDIQQLVQNKEEGPEEQKPDLDQQDPETLHIKEEEEEVWTTLEAEKLSVKEETDATSSSFPTVPLKSEDDEEKPLFSHLHQHRVEDTDLPNSSSGDHMETTSGESCRGAEPIRATALNTYENNSSSSETEVSEDENEHLSDSGSKTEDSDEDWEESRTPDSGVNSVNKSFSCSECVVHADVQMVQIKEEVPEEQRPDVDQLDPQLLHIKEEEEELWTTVEGEQLSVKEETDATSVSFPVVPLKSEDDEDNPLFSQLHQHQIEDGDFPTNGSADHTETTSGVSGEEAKRTRNPDLNIHENNAYSSETEVSEEEDVNSADSQLKHLSDTGSRASTMKSSNCLVLKKCFKNKKNVNSNKIVQKGLKLFSCDECDKKFTTKSNLDRHMRIHTGEKAFGCEVCGRRFIEKGELNMHMRVHTGEKPFGCEVCGQNFGQRGNLTIHMRIHTGHKPFSCDVCGRSFGQKGNFKTHMRLHTGQKPFTCDVCAQRFNQKEHLNSHLRIHSGQKPFGCDVCGGRFSEKGHLNRHMRMHTGLKPFDCDVCGQKFSEKGHLKGHMRIHTGQKPFGCDFCGRSFCEKGNLNRHIKIHTRQKAVVCSDF